MTSLLHRAVLVGLAALFVGSAQQPPKDCNEERNTCGPEHDHCRCDSPVLPFCNEETGFCGATEIFDRAQPSTYYDNIVHEYDLGKCRDPEGKRLDDVDLIIDGWQVTTESERAKACLELAENDEECANLVAVGVGDSGQN